MQPSIVASFLGGLCIFFLAKFDVNVADHVLAYVVANVHLLYVPVRLRYLCEDLLEEPARLFVVRIGK